MDCSLVKGAWCVGLGGSGRIVDLEHVPDDALLDIEMIANSLSMQCRYGGHVKFHYSVSTHSRHVCDSIVAHYGRPCRAAFAGLLHDFSEALTQDLIRGIKVGLKDEGSKFLAIEKSIQDRVYELNGLYDHEQYHDIVKEYDNRVLRCEVDALSPEGSELQQSVSHIPTVPGLKVSYVTPGVSKTELIVRYNVYHNLLLKGILK